MTRSTRSIRRSEATINAGSVVLSSFSIGGGVCLSLQISSMRTLDCFQPFGASGFSCRPHYQSSMTQSRGSGYLA